MTMTNDGADDETVTLTIDHKQASSAVIAHSYWAKVASPKDGGDPGDLLSKLVDGKQAREADGSVTLTLTPGEYEEFTAMIERYVGAEAADPRHAERLKPLVSERDE